jgi:hypothetical protein
MTSIREIFSTFGPEYLQRYATISLILGERETQYALNRALVRAEQVHDKPEQKEEYKERQPSAPNRIAKFKRETFNN